MKIDLYAGTDAMSNREAARFLQKFGYSFTVWEMHSAPKVIQTGYRNSPLPVFDIRLSNGEHITTDIVSCRMMSEWNARDASTDEIARVHIFDTTLA
jgi:hypothetical protein